MRTGSADVRKRSHDIAVREMHEAIAAQNQVSRRKRVLQQVPLNEPPPCVAVGLLVLTDQFVDHVRADVVDAQVDEAHPVKVAARHIEQRPALQLLHTMEAGGEPSRSARGPTRVPTATPFPAQSDGGISVL
jgi:hypothetical protein